MRMLDVNILVQAHREDADTHLEVRLWLEKAMAEPPGVAVSDLVLSGFLRVVTHTMVFKEPTPLNVALEFVADFRSREEVHVLAPGRGHWGIFCGLCKTAEAKGNQIPDAYHAALAMETGCEWVTLDRGFGRYRDLRWSSPLD